MAKVQAKKRELPDLGTPSDDSEPAPSSAPVAGFGCEISRQRQEEERQRRKERERCVNLNNFALKIERNACNYAVSRTNTPPEQMRRKTAAQTQ